MDQNIKVILLDIEGTTTPITFVTQQLFPYAATNVEKFLHDTWDCSETKQVIQQLRRQALVDGEEFGGKVPIIKSVNGIVSKTDVLKSAVENVLWQMSLNRKTTALKELQGMVWKKGYESGGIIGIVYDDVKPALQRLRMLKKRIYIYSSGSVNAQKLLFTYTKFGDLLEYFDGHFDSNFGGKNDAASYRKIAEAINCKPEEILFLTDIEYEADAAISAGLHVHSKLKFSFE
uniref:enolase-phosphatase E1-like n=1 Tax=Ciona intestinalis TaxID=7719 RepID=UPI000521AEA7|nr:enolase-phosphatase E1-like [Ciona intestinalis]|eukprot:XP_009861360.1 enolase-phosphatase E1-like [Ciona intestinalis]